MEKALFRLQETIREVNKAKDDPKTRRLIEITWQLQDRLVFQEQVSRLPTIHQLRLTHHRPFRVLSYFAYLDTCFCVASSMLPIKPQNV